MNGELKYSFMGIFLAIFILFGGCTSTKTTSQIISDDTVKAITEAVSKLDKEQVKKLEEAIKENLKDANTDTTIDRGSTGTNNQTTEIKEQETEDADRDIEASKSLLDVSSLKWTSTGDPHGIVQCYFGYGHDSELFKMIAGLPVDFTCTLGKGIVITKPASDDTALMTSYPGNHMQARRAFACFFDTNGNLTACEDFANTLTFDSRWKGRGEVKGLIVHCKQGNAVSRTALTEVE